MADANVILAAELIRSVSVIKEDGRIIEPPLETYMSHMGLGRYETEVALDDAIELMLDDGDIYEHGGDYYLSEVSDRYLDHEEEQLAKFQEKYC